MSHRCERRVRAVVGVTLPVLLEACVGPARTPDDYVRKASTSLRAAGHAVLRPPLPDTVRALGPGGGVGDETVRISGSAADLFGPEPVPT